MMLFPEILEDETLYSLVARLSMINGYSPSNLPICFDPAQPVRAADLIVDLQSLSLNTNSVYGDANALARRFKIVEKNHDLNAGISLIEYSNPIRNIWKWCEECREEELVNIGISYWHSQVQCECSFICIKHKKPLRVINLPFRDRQSRFLLPTDTTYMEHSSACNEGSFDIAFHITIIQESIFREDLAWDPLTLEQLFVLRQKCNQWEGLLDKVVLMLAMDNQRTASFMKSLLNSSSPPRGYLPVLIYLVFGSYEAFKLNYQWAEVFKKTPKKINTALETDKLRHRNIFRSFINCNPNASKTNFWKSHPKTARWLNKYDASWLTKHTSKLKRYKSLQLNLFGSMQD